MEKNRFYWWSQIEQAALNLNRWRIENVFEADNNQDRRRLGLLRVVRSARESQTMTPEDIAKAIHAGTEAAGRRKVLDERPRRKIRPPNWCADEDNDGGILGHK